MASNDVGRVAQVVAKATPYAILQGDSRERLRDLPAESVDLVVTDPPYGLSREPDIAEVMRHWLAGDPYVHSDKGGFMGKAWDSFVPGPEYWREVARAMKPGALLFAFCGTRTADLLSVAIRFAGLENRETIRANGPAWLGWLHGSGFPKGRDMAKETDGHLGVDTEAPEHWQQADHPGRPGRRTAPHSGEIIGQTDHTNPQNPEGLRFLYQPVTEEAQAAAGRHTAIKPSWEVILVFRKPLVNIPWDEVAACLPGQGYWWTSSVLRYPRTSAARDRRPASKRGKKSRYKWERWSGYSLREGEPHRILWVCRNRKTGRARYVEQEPLPWASWSTNTADAHLLRYGTGCYNMGACRVGTVRKVHTFSDFSEYHGNNFGATNTHCPSMGKKESAPGRWPPNVIQILHPLTQQMGERRVSCGSGDRQETSGVARSMFGVGETYSGQHFDEGDGKETVPAWEAPALCLTCGAVYPSETGAAPAPCPICTREARWLDPVAMVDQQSGYLKAQDGRDWHGGPEHGTGKGATYLTTKTTGQHYSDSGGASRFYPILQPESRWLDPVAMLDGQSGLLRSFEGRRGDRTPDGRVLVYGGGQGPQCKDSVRGYNESGGASRFYPILQPSEEPQPLDVGDGFIYSSKASRGERNRGLDTTEEDHPNDHPTVKPLAVMEWLVRLGAPRPGSVILDPFCGSGTTLLAAVAEGHHGIGVELDPKWVAVAQARVEHTLAGDRLQGEEVPAQVGHTREERLLYRIAPPRVRRVLRGLEARRERRRWLG